MLDAVGNEMRRSRLRHQRRVTGTWMDVTVTMTERRIELNILFCATSKSPLTISLADAMARYTEILG